MMFVTDERLVTHDGLDTGSRAILRLDPGGERRVLGVVKGRYSYAQPWETLALNLFPFHEAGVEVERVTVLQHGAKIAVQMKLPADAIRIGGESGTEIRPLLTYRDSFDGSTPADIRDICQVVVCLHGRPWMPSGNP